MARPDSRSGSRVATCWSASSSARSCCGIQRGNSSGRPRSAALSGPRSKTIWSRRRASIHRRDMSTLVSERPCQWARSRTPTAARRLGLMSNGRWPRPRHLTEDSVLARNGPGFVRRVVPLQFPTVVHASQAASPPVPRPCARRTPTRSPSRIVGAIESPTPARISDAPGAPMRPAPTAPRTLPSPRSRPIRVRRTRPRTGRSPRTVPSQLLSPSRRSDSPAFRSDRADLEVRNAAAPAFQVGSDRSRQPRPPTRRVVVR